MKKKYVKNVPKKISDMSKVKSYANKGKRVKAHIKQHGFDTDVTAISGPMSNIPPLDRLREEAWIQAEVQNRFRQLAANAKPGTEKIKSQRGGRKMYLLATVKWPHKFVLSGQNKDRVSYNQLSPIQWMVDFCGSIAAICQ